MNIQNHQPPIEKLMTQMEKIDPDWDIPHDNYRSIYRQAIRELKSQHPLVSQ